MSRTGSGGRSAGTNSSGPLQLQTKSVDSKYDSEKNSVGVFVQLPRLQNIRFDVVVTGDSYKVDLLNNRLSV